MRRLFPGIATVLILAACILPPFVRYSDREGQLRAAADAYYVLRASESPMAPSDVNRKALKVDVLKGKVRLGQLPLPPSKSSGFQLTRDEAGELRVKIGQDGDFLRFFSDGSELCVRAYTYGLTPFVSDFEALVIMEARGEPLPVSDRFAWSVKLRELFGRRRRFDLPNHVDGNLLYRCRPMTLWFSNRLQRHSLNESSEGGLAIPMDSQNVPHNELRAQRDGGRSLTKTR